MNALWRVYDRIVRLLKGEVCVGCGGRAETIACLTIKYHQPNGTTTFRVTRGPYWMCVNCSQEFFSDPEGFKLKAEQGPS